MLTLNFSPFPTLNTERLTLRKITIEDADSVFALRSDERVNKFIDRPLAHSVEDARNFINQIRSRGSNNELLYWAITQKKKSTLIGTIVLWNISRDEQRAEVGFELLPDFQGQGLMREALFEVIKYGFKDLGLQTIEALPEEENEKSIVLLTRSNFKKDATYDHLTEQPNMTCTTVRYTLTAKNFYN